jgi:hypothetical protein
VADDLAFSESERCVACIRFWLPHDAAELAHRALLRCRRLARDPLRPTWVYFEIILAHFIRSVDTPEARRVNRRHKIISRDQFWCRCPGCTSRANLHEHHIKPRAQGGSNDAWNLTTLCAGHHVHGLHAGVLVMGGWAPEKLATKLGIHPRTGRPLASYLNERRVRAEAAEGEIAAWRAWWRDRQAAPLSQAGPLPPAVIPWDRMPDRMTAGALASRMPSMRVPGSPSPHAPHSSPSPCVP